MTDSLTSLLAFVLLALAFVILTVLAHRTKPRQKTAFTVGLAVTTAITGLLWWCTSPSFALLSTAAQALTCTGFALLSLLYSRCVLMSRSALRWAGALIAILVLSIALVFDLVCDTRTRDAAAALALIILGTNFFGHLIRARINLMQLRAPGGVKEKAKIKAALALIKKHPDEAASDTLDTLTADIVVGEPDIAPTVQSLMSLTGVAPDFCQRVDIEAKAPAKMHDLIYAARIAQMMGKHSVKRLSISVNAADITFETQDGLPAESICRLSLALYGLALDAVETNDRKLLARFRKR